MPENFSQNKTPEQNVKTSIDKILGKDTTLKRRRKTSADLKKEIFVKFINIMLYLDIRNAELNSKFNMNMDDYDEPFMESLDQLLKLTFNNRQLEIIYFYLYERIDIEGRPIAMKDDNDNIIPTNTPEEVWYAIQNL
jgi:hypothetical protein